MAGECSTIDLIINIILLDILHISTLSLVGPITNPTLLHIIWPLNCFSDIWDESEAIIDVVSCCSHERCQEFLFVYESNWRIQSPTIFEETSKSWLKKPHEYVLDNIHERSILGGVKTRAIDANSNPIWTCLCKKANDECYFIIALDELSENLLYWIPKHGLHESCMTTEILAGIFYISRSIIHTL